MGTSGSKRSDEVPGNEERVEKFVAMIDILGKENSDVTKIPIMSIVEMERMLMLAILWRFNTGIVTIVEWEKMLIALDLGRRNRGKKKLRLSSARRKFGIKPPRRKKKVPTCTRKRRMFSFTWSAVAVLIMQPCEASLGLSPRASIKSETYTLGEDLYLLCISKGSPNTTSWMKGKNNTILTMGNSSESEKLQTNFFINNNASSYILKIRNFTLNDFGEYFCEFDFWKSNIIKIDYQHLVYQPKSNEISVTVKTSQKNLNVSIIIEKVFPKPNCTIQAFNWTINAYVETIEGSIFYTMTGHQLLKKEDMPCVFNVTLLCDLRVSSSFSETTQIQYCEGKTNTENKTATIAATLIAVTVLIIGTCTVWYLRKRGKKSIEIQERERDISVCNILLNH